MTTLKSNYLVKKRNVLNEIRANNMTLQELRFFSIYLSKINPKDINTRLVRFSVADFQKIMEIGRINIDYMKQTINSLLCKVVNVPLDNGGYTGFQLFKECTVFLNENNEWYIEIDAHDKALPLMFEFKERYFSYQLWNALRLRSPNQLRMYEILKQYEKIGERILSVEELRELLGIEKKEYLRFDNFKARVLDPCKAALIESTDISFAYEPHGKKGKGGKILFLKFIIKKNTKYTDQLTLEEFIEFNQPEIDDEEPEGICSSRIKFLCDACDNEFSESEITVLYNLMVEHLPYDTIRDELKCYDYLMRKYNELKMRSKKAKVTYRFAYLKTLIETE